MPIQFIARHTSEAQKEDYRSWTLEDEDLWVPSRDSFLLLLTMRGEKIRYKCFINNNTKSNLSKYKKQLQTTYIT